MVGKAKVSHSEGSSHGYPELPKSGLRQVISSPGPVLFLYEARFRLRISGCCTKVHFLLPAACCSEILGPPPPLYDLTPCAPVFLARIVPLINSVLSSCISVQGNRLLLEPLLSRPHCLYTNITNGRLYLQRKSTMCLLPVLFLELLEFGGWVSS